MEQIEKNQPYLGNNKSQFEKLQQKELRLLCFLAYFGDAKGISSSYRYKEVDIDTALLLQKKGYLQSTEKVLPEYHLDLLDVLAIEHKEWLSIFKSYAKVPYNNHTIDYLWKLAELLRKDEFDKAAQLTKPYESLGTRHFNLYSYIWRRAMCDSRYLKLLDDEQVFVFVTETLEHFLRNGKLDEQVLNSTLTFVPKESPRYRELEERTVLYKYFLTGQSVEIEKPQSIWGFSVCAIKELYRGNVEDSMTYFEKAVKSQGSRNGALPTPILNYFFALCTIKYGTKYGSSVKKSVVESLRTSSTIRHDSKHFAARLLLEYYDSSLDEIMYSVRTESVRAISKSCDNLSRCFIVLLSHFFVLPDKSFERYDQTVPATAVMAHELSSYLPLNKKTQTELAKLFDGPPILSSLRRKNRLEKTLLSVESQIQECKEIKGKRIIYFVEGSQFRSLVEQEKQEDLTWEDTQELSIKTFCTKGYESMDLIDYKIACQLSNKTNGQTDIDILIPLLRDSGRLFIGSEYKNPRKETCIKEEMPYIQFSMKEEEIEVSTNIKKDSQGKILRWSVSYRNGTYFIVGISPMHISLLSKILATDRLPLNMCSMLSKTIEDLRSIVDVKENFLALTKKEAYMSEGMIAVRIEPIKKDYQVSLLACGVNNGVNRFVPAAGKEYVSDEDEYGQYHYVRRSLKKEHENYQNLVKFLKDRECQFTSNNVFHTASERVLLDLLYFCHERNSRYIIEWPNGKILKFKGFVSEKDIDIEVRTEIDWFQVEGKIAIDNTSITLEELLSQYCNRSYDGFIRIGDNEFYRMTDTLRKRIAELSAVLNRNENKKKQVPKYLIGTLANIVEGLKANTDLGYRTFMLRMREAYTADIYIPAELNATLRPYQEEGYKWMSRLDRWGAGACLADDMGLGKTLQALTFLLSKAGNGPSLVVAPKSVIPNWIHEAARFTPQLKVKNLNEEKDRSSVITKSSSYNLILCTYGILSTEVDSLSAKHWNVVCLDEAHLIKNRNTNASAAAMSLQSQSRIILTGTPLQNHVGELWNLMQFLNPGMLGRWSVFRDTYINAPLDENHKDMLKEMTQPFILRRTKEQVLTELPDKIEHIEYVTLTNAERKVYEKMRSLVELKFKKKRSYEESKAAKEIEISFFEELTKLRLACCDMKLVYDKWKEAQSSKVTTLMEIVTTLFKSQGNSILIFSQFTSFMALIRPLLEKQGIDYLYLDGQTSMRKRQMMVEQFQKGEKRVFLSSLKAGGLGVNLTAANNVILLDPWWNPAIENQATDRAHRMGQRRCVSVIRLIAEQTIEEKIIKLHEKKSQVSEMILSDTSESYKLTYEDILDMVSPY